MLKKKEKSVKGVPSSFKDYVMSTGQAASLDVSILCKANDSFDLSSYLQGSASTKF